MQRNHDFKRFIPTSIGPSVRVPPAKSVFDVPLANFINQDSDEPFALNKDRS